MASNEILLAALRDLPIPADLSLLDDAVLAGVRERQQLGSVSRLAVGAFGTLALGVGLAGGSFASSAASASEPQMTLNSVNALAPSKLLDGF